MTRTQAPPLKLLMPVSEAAQKIGNLLTEWKECKDLRIDNENGLERARKACLKWSDYHRLLMRRVFAGEEAADEYTGSDIDVNISGATLYEGIDDLRAQIDKKIYCLESIYDHMRSMTAGDFAAVDEPVPDRVKEKQSDSNAADGPATVDATAPARTKERQSSSAPAGGPVAVDPVVPARAKGMSRNPGIFISHGNDETAGKKVAMFMERLELTPIMMRERPDDNDSALIEKTEENADAVFGIVLLAPEDEGRKKGDPALRDRAGQNVLVELGYLIGRLGRNHVCALCMGPVEMPMDNLGVLFLPFDDSGDYWQLKLAKELKRAGLPVDMNKAV